MTPLDHLRLWFVGLDSDLQGEITFALVPTLEDNFRGRRF
jgi:aspartyl/asparaginyl beta-hydroxylase (cupin superfamily)